MAKHKQPRPRGGNDSAEENLRGRNRSLVKEIKRLQGRVKRMEKRGIEEPDEILEVQEPVREEVSYKKAPRCKKCKSFDVALVKIPRRNGDLSMLCCNNCPYREKIE